MQYSQVSQIFTIISIALSLLFPVGVAFYFRKKEKISWKVIGIGVLVWFVSVQILEGTLHYFVLQNTPLRQIPWAFILYGTLMAGVFEEVGRYVGMRYLLKQYREWKDGVAYGIGHGGIEAILLGVIGNIQILALGAILNAGQLDKVQLPASSLPLITQLLTSPSWVFLISGFERIFAFIVHIGLSLVVLYSVTSGKKRFLVYAIILHAVFDLLPAMYQMKIAPLWLTEVIVMLFALVTLYILKDSRKYFSSR